MDNSMDLAVNITGNADSVVAAAGQAGSAISGFEGVSAGAIASLTAAIEKLDIDFSALGASAIKSSEGVKAAGVASAETTGLLKDMNQAGGSAARMFSALGSSAGEAAGRVEAFTGVLDSMTALAPEILAIGAAIAVVGSAFTFVKDGVQDAINLEQSMTRLRAVVDEQGQSWATASQQIKEFIDNESLASGIGTTELAGALSELAGQIHNVHDAEIMLRVAEEEHIATGKSLTEVTNALLEAEAGRGMTLAQLDPRLKNLIHDHTDLHTILDVLHKDNRDALADANSTAMAWSRLHVIFETIGEDIGGALLPFLTNLGKGFMVVGNIAVDIWNAIVAGAESAKYEILAVGAVLEGVAAAWADVKAGNFGNVGKDMQFGLNAANADLRQSEIEYVKAQDEWSAAFTNSVNQTTAQLRDAVREHQAALEDFSLDNNPDVGFARGGHKGGHGGKGHSGKAAIPTLGSGSAVVTYDDSIKMTTKDQAKFTAALYATGDALAKQIIGLDKSREANAQKNEDERATYGMSIEQELAYYQQRLDNLDKFDADYLAKKTALENKIDDLQTEEHKKQVDAAKKAHDEQLKLIDEWAAKGVTLFNDFFDKGKKGFKDFADAWKKMLDDMLQALEKSALIEILGKILNVNVGSFGSVFGQQSGLGSLGIFSQSGNTGGGALSAVGSALGLTGAGAAAGAVYDPGLASAYMQAGMSQGDAISMASSVSSSGPGKGLFGIGGGFGTTANPGIAAYGAALAGGDIIGQTVFGGKGFADVGGAMGAAAAMALAGPVGWGALAAMTLGGALLGGGMGSLFGDHFNPANEPDIYQTDAWGQSNADMNGNTSAWPMNANGKQFAMDSWTQQYTKGKGWNLVMEQFVQKFRGKTSQLPQGLQAVFGDIEQLWGGATNQNHFNNDGKDGYLDIGSGKRAKWTEFWQYVQSYGPQIAQLMDNYQTSDVFNSQNGSASMAGSYAPTGSPYAIHDFPDYAGSSVSAPSSGGSSGGSGGGTGPVSGPPSGGGNPHGGPVSKMSSGVVVNNYISGSLLTEDELFHHAGSAIARQARSGAIRRVNLVGKM